MEPTLSASFAIAGGTVLGTEHRHALRNNQDALAFRETEDALIVVVTDGCSSGHSSEVGARLGAAWLAAAVPELAAAGADSLDVAREATSGLVAYLRGVAGGLGDTRALPGTVNDLFLFAFLVAVVGHERAFVFGVGDGVYAVNGHATVLDPGPENAPPYAAYGLLGAMPEPRVHHSCATGALSSLLVATDGAADLLAHASEPLVDGTLQGCLRPFAEDERYLRNPSLLQKRLVVIGERNGRLRDDTTVAVIRRREASWTSS